MESHAVTFKTLFSVLQWADEKFPLCPGHGKPCTIRIVMKIGPNNGRKFFACKMPKNKQCKFFEWAEGFD
jgi:endonuclease VIII-like 3